MATCYNYGCVDYTPENACQCNPACQIYNDCCKDYSDICEGYNGFSSKEKDLLGDFVSFTLGYSIVSMILIVILCAFLIKYLFIPFLKNEEQKEKSKLLKVMNDKLITLSTLFGILAFFITICCYFVSSIGLRIENENGNILYANSQKSAIIFWSIGYFFYELTLIARLYTIQANQIIYIILTAWFIVAIIGTILFNIEFLSDDWGNIILTRSVVIGFIGHIGFIICGIPFYIAALTKLAAVDIGSKLIDALSNLVDHDIELINHIIRVIVLSIFSMISTLLCFIFWYTFFRHEDEAEGGKGVTLLFFNVSWWLLPLDALIKSLALYLNLPFSYKLYNIIFCCFNPICEPCVMDCVKSAVNPNDTTPIDMELNEETKPTKTNDGEI